VDNLHLRLDDIGKASGWTTGRNCASADVGLFEDGALNGYLHEVVTILVWLLQHSVDTR
jgi:hypothetical protein